MLDASFYTSPRDLDHPDHRRWKEVQEIGDSPETERWIWAQQVKYEQQQREDYPDPQEDREVDSTYPDPASVKRVRDFLNRKRKNGTEPGAPSDNSTREVAGGS